jgi:dTDP-4-dehydrorhamnose reductase
MTILVVGASGMIGSTMLRVLSESTSWEVFGSIRAGSVRRFFPATLGECLLENIDVTSPDALARVVDQVRPAVVVNCAGLTKHKPESEDPLVAVPINTLMPHRLARLCRLSGARLIHISTDCVFSGKKGLYTEDDIPDAGDVYGKSKALGEVNYPNTITLRTSTIGRELDSRYGLLEWFLAQEGICKGYTRAIFSGLPTVVFAQVVRDVVIPRPELSGLYHVAAQPIAKFDLLRVIADIYDKTIDIVPDDHPVIDRSLNAARFQTATGYLAPDWPELISVMHAYH